MTTYKVSIRDDAPADAYVNIRSTGGEPLGQDVGNLERGQVLYGEETIGSPTGKFYGLKTPSGWVHGRWNYSPTYANIELVETPPPSEKKYEVVIEENGAVVKTVQVDTLDIIGDDVIVYQI